MARSLLIEEHANVSSLLRQPNVTETSTETKLNFRTFSNSEFSFLHRHSIRDSDLTAITVFVQRVHTQKIC
jgi:hypothetical protein